MTTYSIDYIVSDPIKRRGRPRINDTGITVHNIAEDYNSGMSVQQIVEAFELTPGQVHAALSYYFDHQAEIDQDLLDDQKQTETYIAEHGVGITLEELKRRIEEHKANR
ncbi:MAG: DUF433 domain-containing protein [Chloroflexota bacterium]